MKELRPITQGPKYHWFGYYDKLQFDETNRYVLGMEVDFEHRSPTPNDVIRVGMVDLQDGNRWIDLGETSAWCWQQGCMLQWLPGHADTIVYNDRAGAGFVSWIHNVKTGERRSVPHSIYALSPDGRYAVGIDHARTGWLRPGYGYAGQDPTKDDAAPKNGGVYRIDLEHGTVELIISIDQIAKIPSPRVDITGLFHWVNHLLFAPGGERFIFLHRCRPRDGGGMTTTRMFTADLDGGDIRLVDDYGGMSHFIWKDDRTILAWATRPSNGPAFYLFDEKTGNAEVIGEGKMVRNGHCTYVPGTDWILNDTYPGGPDDRVQELYVYDPATDTRVDLARPESPPEYSGEWRCDLHPRSSRDGNLVCVDSPHAGGRQLYTVEIGDIVH
jgi:hypothetical protein